MPPKKSPQLKQHQQQHQDTHGLYPIRTVSSLTGVNAITLRAWERRYGLIKPVRTPKGHRLYTQEDIDLIQQIVEQLEKGVSIGQVRDLVASTGTHGKTEKKTDTWNVYQRRLINAIVRFDANSLDQTYNDALSLYPVELVTRRLILPLLKTLGDRWENAQGSVAEEHFFGAYLRNKLGARFHHQSLRSHGPKLIAACFPGEHHEAGLMLFCLSAMNHDCQLVYLGADTPLMELIEPAQRTDAQGILLSGSMDLPARVLQQDLLDLVEAVEVPVFVGGKISVKYHDAIVSAGGIPLGIDIQQGIKHMADELHFKA
jgi:DNA-binding transcriptional MerR regulator/methylmalonyl-CoA mutase cobalamin-binding subunit